MTTHEAASRVLGLLHIHDVGHQLEAQTACSSGSLRSKVHNIKAMQSLTAWLVLDSSFGKDTTKYHSHRTPRAVISRQAFPVIAGTARRRQSHLLLGLSKRPITAPAPMFLGTARRQYCAQG